ncbi:hypothetical protein [Citromicrobium bathyomarinum]|uniref:hypothetical protein n=1 Tax=Citromicrobium bathyomarinum TaxID=72174 RepID=UPI00315A3547
MRFFPSCMAAVSLLLVSSLCYSSPSFAQSGDQQATDRKVEDFAACFVRSPKHRALRKKVLSIPANSTKAIKNFEGVAMSDCMDKVDHPRASAGDIVGAVYTSLYRRLERDDAPEITSRTNFDSEYDEDALPLPQATVDLRVYGNCLASYAPDAAHRFVVAPIWSDSESVEVPSIGKALQACGEPPKFARSHLALKGLIAESLYKSALAQDDE